VPSWVKTFIDDWTTAAGVDSGRVFRAINKRGRVYGDGVLLGHASIQTTERYLGSRMELVSAVNDHLHFDFGST
jgi:hypothetical protein